MVGKEYPPGQGPRKFRPKAVQHESAEQSAVIAWARYHERQWPQLKLLYAVPNGHGVHVAIRQKMIREGLLAGIFDLCLPVARVLRPNPLVSGSYHSLYIEMKWGNNKLSDEQKKIGQLLQAEGHLVTVAYHHEVACQIMVDYLQENPVPTKSLLRYHL